MFISPALAQYGHILNSGGTTTSVMPWLLVAMVVIAIIALAFQGRRRWLRQREKELFKQPVIVRTYRGSQARATALFQADSIKMADLGYFPTSQSWAPGQWGCGAFLVALLLCLVVIGLLIFVYMLIVKPEGTLTVIYERRTAVREAI